MWVDNKKDLLKELRLKPMRRHIFLYQQGLLLCKKVSKDNKPTYHFKKYLRVSRDFFLIVYTVYSFMKN